MAVANSALSDRTSNISRPSVFTSSNAKTARPSSTIPMDTLSQNVSSASRCTVWNPAGSHRPAHRWNGKAIATTCVQYSHTPTGGYADPLGYVKP
eukprot:CAMPEP_0204325848 /NCGR_PEP_ID=MMETSP0469-20131031/11341_1 /ASSEMBLY_ACC=CAM_ASM_000384 /TAXON_ID=2969 /ORGANISM="Oxyrrhis marina" /LENGTH=94 /DNA_ID=CAMNT_0051307777 /DNA_START=62 /DNA_END=346 /DNA_ORIENTATION=+